jgi:hypothetical protein
MGKTSSLKLEVLLKVPARLVILPLTVTVYWPILLASSVLQLRVRVRLSNEMIEVVG